MALLTQKILRSLVSYDQETGVFTWAKARRGAAAGDRAGSNSNGYVVIKLMWQKYQAHRLAWFYVYGEWPNGVLDHINGHKDDNRIVNLRRATKVQNMMNSRRPARNRSGFKGVSFNKEKQKFVAQIKAGPVRRHLGYFSEAAAAFEAYKSAAAELHGAFQRSE
jgi:hypothetical protein